ncbi:hypothetical protein [Nitratireductor basaltis]|uniref:Uncharacterized protein n=1 Tax=Nitratireductor basaltis TaxID=472175 RepID=A0A084UCY1_9HYPH|nr:hypothetical protein [Nitratireductor basaltis]KFB10817.1 hypothetical protein EL18_01857 [Nitratireductor basaltis]
MSDILFDIHKGMRVEDAHGHEIGTVEWVHLSDETPSTPTADAGGTEPLSNERKSSFVDLILDAFRTDEIPQVLHDRMLREGFIRLDADGMFAADRYVLAEQVASVSGDCVKLNVERDALIKER